MLESRNACGVYFIFVFHVANILQFLEALQFCIICLNLQAYLEPSRILRILCKTM